jgi:hypothetical protein
VTVIIERTNVSAAKSIIQEVKEAIEDDDKHPIDEKAPGLPFAVATFSYMAVLVAFAFAVAAFLWLKQ